MGAFPNVDLFLAAEEGNLENVQKAMAAGASIDAYINPDDPFNQSMHNLPPVYKTALMQATSAGHARVVEYLLNRGANPNATGMRNGSDSTGHTALMSAQDLATVKLLLQNKADIKLKDESGETALMHHFRDATIVEYMLSHGADIEDHHLRVVPMRHQPIGVDQGRRACRRRRR